MKIESEDEYWNTLLRVEWLMGASDKDGIDELKYLTILVETYEDETFGFKKESKNEI